MLSLANVEKTIEEVREHIMNGSALRKFEAMIQAQVTWKTFIGHLQPSI